MAGKGWYISGTTNAAQAASTTKTELEQTAASNRMLILRRARISQDTHKTSEQYEVYLQRMTTTGTGTGGTVVLKETNAGAIGFTFKSADSVEPTYTASTILASYRWNSLTGKDIVLPTGHELYIPVSALIGLYTTTPASTTSMSPQAEIEGDEIG